MSIIYHPLLSYGQKSIVWFLHQALRVVAASGFS